MTKAFRTAALISLAIGWLVCASAQDSTIEGRLVVETGKPSVIETGGKSVPVTSARRSVRDTLLDTRISGKRLKLVGRQSPDGSFEVDEFYVVRPDGELYRLVYFCDVCNITRFGPGKCECCQQPTIPTEIPTTDPRVRKN
jgi:hypothetical protein